MTNVTGQRPRCLVYVTDCTTCLWRSSRQYWCSVNITPPSHTERRNRWETFILQAVNGTSIFTYGTCSHTLNLRLRCSFRWVFIIADVATPTLCVDFLCYYNLLVDMRHNHLSDAVISLVSPTPTTHENAWVNTEICWFHNNFVPVVTTCMGKKQSPAKELLLLNNAPAQPDEFNLVSQEGTETSIFHPTQQLLSSLWIKEF